RAGHRRAPAPRASRQRRRRHSLADHCTRAGRSARRLGERRPPLARRRLPPPRRPLVPASRHEQQGSGSMTALRHTWQVALRCIRAPLRQPAWVGISLTQPVIWLLLFGALFKRTADIPGFTGGSYIEFLTPGVVVMLAMSSAWAGMGFIEDINRGTMD